MRRVRFRLWIGYSLCCHLDLGRWKGLSIITIQKERAGPACLFAAINIADGSVIVKCQPRHSHQELLKFLRLIERETPKEKDIHYDSV